RVELKTKILKIHSHQSTGLSSFIPPQFPQQNGRGRRQQQQTCSLNGIERPYSPLLNCSKRWGWALIAICMYVN
uniref:Ovule protein n=1 Tax=Meloidogyne hapla TaxID=6305 RepID=A0A1I8B879_MELHA